MLCPDKLLIILTTMSMLKVKKSAQAQHRANFYLGLFTLLSNTIIKIPVIDKNNKYQSDDVIKTYF